MASLKKASKVVCIGRNYAYVQSIFFKADDRNKQLSNADEDNSSETMSRN
jgi:hypothetical protein